MNHNRNLLVQARRLIACGRQKFICLALEEEGVFLNLDSYVARCAIREQLDGDACLEAWLRTVHNINTISFAGSAARMQRTRLAWIDHMLEHHPLFKE